jgi:N-terminal domain of galactosyltransferase/N-terminal region of glycosyl transferase group 7
MLGNISPEPSANGTHPPNPYHKDHLPILVPYRDREQNLLRFISHMEQFLESAPHRFVVVEQGDDKPFNKGTLLNIGFSLVRDTARCVCFHDVDMIPTGDPSNYVRTTRTTHISGEVEQFDYRLPYLEYMGGVFITPIDEFVKVNGFSNDYWGWGSEDDDLFARFVIAQIPIIRKPGRYSSLPHPAAPPSKTNGSRLMRTFAAITQLPHSGSDKERVDEFKAKYERDFGIREWDPIDIRVDGLTSLTYKSLTRSPLCSAFEFPIDLPPHHEHVKAVLSPP